MKPQLLYKIYDIDPLEFWAMLFGCAQIDGYGREINSAGEPIMHDKLRYIIGREGEHRNWPWYEIIDLNTGLAISPEKYHQLDPPGRKLECDRRPYFPIIQCGKEQDRFYFSYSEVSDDVSKLIRESIGNGTAPVIRLIKEIHGEDKARNAPGRLYHYRKTILDALRWAIRMGEYWQTGITERLLDHVEHGYIGSVEQYQLAWLLGIFVVDVSDYGLNSLGTEELELLRQFVAADETKLCDWFGQSFDNYRGCEGGHFPAIDSGEVFFERKPWMDYGDYVDAQLAYLVKVLQPGVKKRWRKFFREYPDALRVEKFKKLAEVVVN